MQAGKQVGGRCRATNSGARHGRIHTRAAWYTYTYMSHHQQATIGQRNKQQTVCCTSTTHWQQAGHTRKGTIKVSNCARMASTQEAESCNEMMDSLHTWLLCRLIPERPSVKQCTQSLLHAHATHTASARTHNQQVEHTPNTGLGIRGSPWPSMAQQALRCPGVRRRALTGPFDHHGMDGGECAHTPPLTACRYAANSAGTAPRGRHGACSAPCPYCTRQALLAVGLCHASARHLGSVSLGERLAAAPHSTRTPPHPSSRPACFCALCLAHGAHTTPPSGRPHPPLYGGRESSSHMLAMGPAASVACTRAKGHRTRRVNEAAGAACD